MPRKPRPSSLAGFTLVELMVGIIVCSIVLSAMASFFYATARVWESTDAGQSAYVAGNRGSDRIGRLVRGAKMLDPNFTSGLSAGQPAACMIWAGDNNDDGKIQFSETALLAYDPDSQSLVSYAVTFPAGWTPAQAAAADTTCTTLMTPQAFMASPNVTATPVVHNVTSCQFNVVSPAESTGERSSLEVVLTIDDGRGKTVVYSTTTLRAPLEAN